MQQLPTEEVDHHWQNVKLFLFQSERDRKLSKREYIFKPGMQFVLSARRTLTGLPDIGSYKVSQRPTTTSTIQPSTLWSQQVDAYPALNKYQHERMFTNISFAGSRCLPIIASVVTV